MTTAALCAPSEGARFVTATDGRARVPVYPSVK